MLHNLPEFTPLWLTLRLALVTTLILLGIGLPLAWWLVRTKHWLKGPIQALVLLPLVLPPTVLGFYLLLMFSPQQAFGQWLANWIGPLVFTFRGLVVASVIYSLPMVIFPLVNAFESLDPKLWEAAATLRAGAWDRFFSVIVPLSWRGIGAASMLGFTHTVGEFGVVLMIGGNIPGETQVLSVALYGYVEALHYSQAHWLAGMLVLFSFGSLLLLFARRPGWRT